MSNLDIYRGFVERGYNQGDLSIVEEVCSPDFVSHQYLAPEGRGLNVLREDIKGVLAAFEDVKLTLADATEAGDKVWSRIDFEGIDRNSGQRVTFAVMDVARFENGKMVEHWGVPDRFALLHQTGQLSA